MRIQFSKFVYMAGILLALIFTLGCAPDIEPPPPPKYSSSSNELPEYGYCVYAEMRTCFQGSYTSCPGADGELSNFCPFPTPSSSSHGEAAESSSSNGNAGGYCVFAADRICLAGPVSVCPPGGALSNACPYSSSSSAIPVSSSAPLSSSSLAAVRSSSSAIVPSSSSECMNASGTYCNYGGCQTWGSDGWSCARHINGYANEGGCYPMPTEDNCNSGTIVSVCPANATPPASNYCKIQSSSSVAVVPSSSSPVSGTSGTFTDARDSKVYKWVKIGTQIWMAENLNYNASGSKCYDNQDSYCTQYGRFYNWATAMDIPSSYNTTLYNPSASTKYRGVCPVGWHIPNGMEWSVLMKVANPSCTDNSSCALAGTKLKSVSGWNLYNGVPKGTDEFGFSALPSGCGDPDGSIGGAGDCGRWWSTSEYNSIRSYYRDIIYRSEYAYWVDYDKSSFLSIRCVAD